MNVIKCPACGKENDEAKECARCGCELSILASICRAAEQGLLMGKKSLENGDILMAMHHAGKSWHLKKSPAAARLAFLTALASGDFAQAGKWYARTGKST